jgi:uncharacterized protein YbcI
VTAIEHDHPGFAGGELNSAIARDVVRLLKRRTGRGPTLARAFFRDKVLVVVLEQTLTQGEQLLVGAGDRETAKGVRDRLNAAMRDELVGVVEDLTGGTVEALVTGTQVDPDYGAFVFVLDRRITPEPVVQAPHHMHLVD